MIKLIAISKLLRTGNAEHNYPKATEQNYPKGEKEEE